jgi:Tol biopolymer transport system component
MRRNDDTVNGVGDIWVLDLSRKAKSRLTFDPANDHDPHWSPDGTRILFGSNRDGIDNLYTKNAAGTGNDELLLKTAYNKVPNDWSRQGILYTELDPKTGRDIWFLPDTGDKKPAPYLQTSFNEDEARFSPDGRWIAYRSDETGRSEIYVQSFPPSGGKWQISTTGGGQPRWRADGRELFFVPSGGSGLWAVDIETKAGTFRQGVAHKLADVQFNNMTPATDGERFLLAQSPIENDLSGLPAIRVFLNWASGLTK